MPQSRHLLVIDDQRLDRAIAAHAARQTGITVSAAATIAETLALLEAGQRFDFVVLDLSLGSEDGLEVLPLIARFNPSAVVILASGFDGRVLAASQRLASSLGLLVAGVLRKPILPTALQRLLRQAPHILNQGATAAVVISPGQLAHAIEHGDIIAWFQPQASLVTGIIGGAEALARWVWPDGRAVSPAAFVPVAEQNGMAAALTFSVLDQALLACACWRDTRPDCSVSVNLSPLLLNDPTITDRIEWLLQKHRVPPGALVLEVTETYGIPDTSCAMEILTRLRIRGINLAVDDFGTGHSSLLSLMRTPFNEMKIDQAFVRDAISNRDARKVVRASASLGRELGLKVVAEGVETEAMAQLVGEAGCHIGQGWLYGHAVPADVFKAKLALTHDMPIAGLSA
ncbi:MAG TPA: EAL domain-containing response regulator [Rhodopila sp.]|jgi:EAL domain-containing protein (putative c-di-GMP-specific phosphodiesterase class I)|nr:EAL domain-containing response regulator [Rhodopila sp.]